jgi:hypothetical protein
MQLAVCSMSRFEAVKREAIRVAYSLPQQAIFDGKSL